MSDRHVKKRSLRKTRSVNLVEKVKQSSKNLGSMFHHTDMDDIDDIDRIFDSSDLGQAVSADIGDISNVLTEHINKKMEETYEIASDITKDNKNQLFSTFQGLLKDYKDWDTKTRKLFARNVRKDMRDLNNIVRSSIIGVAQIRYLWASRSKGISKRKCNRVLQAISISRSIPNTEDFLHWCCCRAVMDIYSKPYLFDNRESLSVKAQHANKIARKEFIKNAIEEEMYSRNNANFIIQSAINYVQGSSSKYNSESSSSEESDHETHKRSRIKSKKPRKSEHEQSGGVDYETDNDQEDNKDDTKEIQIQTPSSRSQNSRSDKTLQTKKTKRDMKKDIKQDIEDRTKTANDQSDNESESSLPDDEDTSSESSVTDNSEYSDSQSDYTSSSDDYSDHFVRTKSRKSTNQSRKISRRKVSRSPSPEIHQPKRRQKNKDVYTKKGGNRSLPTKRDKSKRKIVRKESKNISSYPTEERKHVSSSKHSSSWGEKRETKKQKQEHKKFVVSETVLGTKSDRESPTRRANGRDSEGEEIEVVDEAEYTEGSELEDDREDNELDPDGEEEDEYWRSLRAEINNNESFEESEMSPEEQDEQSTYNESENDEEYDDREEDMEQDSFWSVLQREAQRYLGGAETEENEEVPSHDEVEAKTKQVKKSQDKAKKKSKIENKENENESYDEEIDDAVDMMNPSAAENGVDLDSDED